MFLISYSRQPFIVVLKCVIAATAECLRSAGLLLSSSCGAEAPRGAVSKYSRETPGPNKCASDLLFTDPSYSIVLTVLQIVQRFGQLPFSSETNFPLFSTRLITPRSASDQNAAVCLRFIYFHEPLEGMLQRKANLFI